MFSQVCIDTNFVNYICEFEKFDVSLWLEQIYSEIIVVPKVLEELSVKKEAFLYCKKKIESGKWLEMNPLDSDSESLYLNVYGRVLKDFMRYQEERTSKTTTDKADIQILAMCLTFEIPIITSNDNDFRHVITNNNYKINPTNDLEAEEVFIEVDGLLEFSKKCANNHVSSISNIKKFVKAVAPAGQKERLMEGLKNL